MLDSELGRLSQALAVSEQRRRAAERTLAAVATDAAGRLLAVQAQRDEAIAERDALRQVLDGQPRSRTSPAVVSDELRIVPRGRAWRVLVVCALILGMLIVIDGVLTIVWQEPVSAIFAARSQHRLSKELEQIDNLPTFSKLRSSRYLHYAATREAKARRYVAAAEWLNEVRPGHAVGRIKIPSIGASFAVIEGTSTGDLEQGPGHYRGTMLPGLPGTFAVAGHRTTFLAPFRHLDRLHDGSRIIVTMPYGRYVYRVVNKFTTIPSNVAVISHRKGPEKLVLTACDPPGSAAQRLVISAIPI